ncbi:isocitrate lyase/PEP mutase family protein [Ktedonobacter racemifer]|uniref:2-methylisocitrate lyase n=1 Tax=Ktedonobacter racemifer DSM 44963 TaxID=485913 RepID=D6U5D6_KTERA|nr:oxaloacetate decarboxylase [Ktedonobacter racemifer]EFH81716.1 isocitrate lyase and phosphorylmutase [Ktedonobacter racemifer DSM 44963]
MAHLLKKERDPGRLRKLLEGPEPVLAPGAYDCLSALLIEQAGFDVVYMTDYGTAASYLGCPDVGIVSSTEEVSQAHRIVQAVNVPVIADADTGYGNALNVIHTVNELEQAGVSAMQIEDQVSPKRCGHMEDKAVIETEEMVEKIRAIVESRRSKDFLIIARTDARAVEGLDSALERARSYRDAGADVLFIEAPQSEEEVVAIAKAFPNVPRLLNCLEDGKTPLLTYARLKELGFRLIIYPLSTLFTATRAMKESLAQIRAQGTPIPVLDRMVSFQEFTDIVGLPEIQEIRSRFAPGHFAPAGW